MSKHEQDIRSAASTLHAAIIAGQAAGLHVEPSNLAADCAAIAISETTASILTAVRGEVRVEVTVPSDVPDEVLNQAKDRALAAATEVLAQATSASVPTVQPALVDTAALEAMTKADLQKLADERGITVPSGAPKADFVAALNT